MTDEWLTLLAPDWPAIAREQARIRQRLLSAREKREQGKWLRAEGTAELESAIIQCEGLLGVSEIARLSGVSRRAVYDILERIEHCLD